MSTEPAIVSTAKITARGRTIERARIEALLDAAGPEATFTVNQTHGDPRDPRESGFIETTITATWTNDSPAPQPNLVEDGLGHGSDLGGYR